MTLFIGEREITPTIITQGGGSSDKYKVGDRVNDDSNNPVGTVSSIFTDGNGQRYAVVCLDAVNRLTSGRFSEVAVTGIPIYQNQTVWSASETAKTNTDAILAAGISTACSHCRSKSFTIGGVSYYGQLPNVNELTQIFAQRAIINNQDPTASSYSSLIIPTNATYIWSSTLYSSDYYNWGINSQGVCTWIPKTNNGFVIPVLEIPLEN